MAVNKTNDAAETSVSEQKQKQKAELEQASAGFCVYIGPTIPGVIQMNTIYHGSKEEVLARADVKLASDRYDGISALIVDGNDLNKSIEKIIVRGEELNKAARSITKKQ